MQSMCLNQLKSKGACALNDIHRFVGQIAEHVKRHTNWYIMIFTASWFSLLVSSALCHYSGIKQHDERTSITEACCYQLHPCRLHVAIPCEPLHLKYSQIYSKSINALANGISLAIASLHDWVCMPKGTSMVSYHSHGSLSSWRHIA